MVAGCCGDPGIAQEVGIAPPPAPPSTVRVMDENPKRCETIKAFAEPCEMKCRVLLGSQLESWEPAGLVHSVHFVHVVSVGRAAP
ncbi:MAG: hypothetical protein GX117_14320 [Candidatus Hydrogenedentes bacterium]|nr:hypothetical protein [Candidatus Hydrogenedentota bacterium]